MACWSEYTVTYRNVPVGDELVVDGQIHRVLPDGTVTPTGIVGQVAFTPSTPAGSVEVPFTVPVGLDAGTYVVFERLTFELRPLAPDEDPADTLQTFVVVVPVVSTSVTSEVDGGRVVGVQGGPVTDQVVLHGSAPYRRCRGHGDGRAATARR